MICFFQHFTPLFNTSEKLKLKPVFKKVVEVAVVKIYWGLFSRGNIKIANLLIERF